MDAETRELVKELKEFGYEYDDGPLGLALAKAAETIERLDLATMNQRSWVDTERLDRIATIAAGIAHGYDPSAVRMHANDAIAIERAIREAVEEQSNE